AIAGAEGRDPGCRDRGAESTTRTGTKTSTARPARSHQRPHQPQGVSMTTIQEQIAQAILEQVHPDAAQEKNTGYRHAARIAREFVPEGAGVVGHYCAQCRSHGGHDTAGHDELDDTVDGPVVDEA